MATREEQCHLLGDSGRRLLVVLAQVPGPGQQVFQLHGMGVTASDRGNALAEIPRPAKLPHLAQLPIFVCAQRHRHRRNQRHPEEPTSTQGQPKKYSVFVTFLPTGLNYLFYFDMAQCPINKRIDKKLFSIT